LIRSGLVFGALLAAAAALAIYLLADLATYNHDREQASIALGKQAGQRVAEALDSLLLDIAGRAENYAGEVAAIRSEAELLESIRAESLRLPIILGVTVAFEPGRFAGKERYAPFFNKSRNEFQFVEDTYDYRSADLDTSKWYTGVVDSGQSSWSEPYYAQAAQAMVVDYGTPLLDADGEIIGMVDYTLGLSDFTRVVDSLSIGESGYGFTYDSNGAILSHPDPENLMQNVFRLKDGKTRATLDKLKNTPEGVVEYQSTYTYKFSWFFFRELVSTGWKSVLVFAEDDLLGASDQGRRKTIHVCIGVSVFLIILVAFLLRVDRPDPEKLWWMVSALSLIIVANIVAIWYLNLTTDFSLLRSDQERIVNKSILNKYVNRYDRNLFKLAQVEYRKVPTGIFIESFELSAFEASLIGKLWMKYPKSLYDSAPPAFYFPDTSAIESRGLVSEIISEVDQGDDVLVTWKFRVTLEQDFSYRQFPFEQNDVQVRILYPDLSKNILLVPDLDSYHVLNPSARPGLNGAISVPSSETVSSYFTFEDIAYQTTFGNRAPVADYPALRFTIVVKRIFLNPFIANIIPILIVALIMFIVLYIASREHDERSGVTTMSVIQSSAGFLFILLLAHVNERNRIVTPEIAYIELFYFSMYVLVSLQAIVLAMLFRGSRWKIFEYHDNLSLKLSFWPVLLGIWYAVTLLRFY
jgi:hypothetical protein